MRSVDRSVDRFVAGGGRILVQATDIPVGRLAVVEDPFGNSLVLVELSKGTYAADGTVVPLRSS